MSLCADAPFFAANALIFGGAKGVQSDKRPPGAISMVGRTLPHPASLARRGPSP